MGTEDQSPDIGRATEKTSEQMVKEMFDSIVDQNSQLEGQLGPNIPWVDNTHMIVFYTNPTEPIYFGIHSKDGPIIVGREIGKELVKRESGADRTTVWIYEAKPPQMDYDHNSFRKVSDLNDLEHWKQAFQSAKVGAERRATEIKSKRDILPNALEFVKSQGITTETVSGDTSVGADLIRPSA